MAEKIKMTVNTSASGGGKYEQLDHTAECIGLDSDITEEKTGKPMYWWRVFRREIADPTHIVVALGTSPSKTVPPTRFPYIASRGFGK